VDGYLRIGELARRTGTSPEVLRAWERRYHVLRPHRSAGGFRLYGPRDEATVRRIQALMADGLSAGQAARVASEAPAITASEGPTSPVLRELALRLEQAVDRFDEPDAHEALDQLLGAFSPEVVFRRVLLPYLRRLGERWATGEVTVGQEHFASGFIRGRLWAMARGWGQGPGPLAILACPPGEQHDLPLLFFGITLHRRGWRIAYLGPDTPLDTLATTASALSPDLVVLAATRPDALENGAGTITDLAARVPVAIAGAGASGDLAADLGARWLDQDSVEAAGTVDASFHGSGRDPGGSRRSAAR
jgi:DNA-binding transcriptional MerR regulator